MHIRRKLRIDKPVYWDHHRGGWKYVVKEITSQLHTDDGLLLVTAVEDELHLNGPIREPWVGFIHQVPIHRMNFPDLERLISSQAWKTSLKKCLGLFVMTDYQNDFLRANGVNVPICKLNYPLAPFELHFNYDQFLDNRSPKLLMIGEFLRNYKPFFDLKVPNYKKILLAYEGFTLAKHKISENSDVDVLARVEETVYDELLSKNLVYLNLFDAVAVTTIIECIGRGTPIVIKPVGAVKELLGSNYPLYFEKDGDVEPMLNDKDIIKSAHSALLNNPLRHRLCINDFIKDITKCAIYGLLPTPVSEEIGYAKKDVSVLICNYSRTYNLEKIVSRLISRDDNLRIEIIIWNNSPEETETVEHIRQTYNTPQLPIVVFNSSENFFCAIRTSIHSFMKSDILLICDDDIIPNTNFVSTFYDAYLRLGPSVALCSRGHLIHPHELDEADPGKAWAEHDCTRLEFLNESATERQIHFMHADTCLIPKKLLHAIARYEVPDPAVYLVDDYWISFVLSYYLKVPIVKLNMAQCFEITPCADDPSIAMFHNARVIEERIKFYIFHMRLGWPSPISKKDIYSIPRGC